MLAQHNSALWQDRGHCQELLAGSNLLKCKHLGSARWFEQPEQLQTHADEHNATSRIFSNILQFAICSAFLMGLIMSKIAC